METRAKIHREITRAGNFIPGIGLCLGVTLIAVGLQAAEVFLFGRAWLEALVLAILSGAAVRTLWTPPKAFEAGISFCARFVLEVAVVLLGATISGAMLASVGLSLLFGIGLVVMLAIGASYGLCRLFGLPTRMAVLVACGNSICGNSAIAAVAPVIRAKSDDVAAAIAFTAVLGVAVVVGLPILGGALGFSPRAYGVLAGLTVYAVPQVLAATAPVSTLSSQIGTLVKLARVLMLGPVTFFLALVFSGGGEKGVRSLRFGQLVPWFIIGFVVLIALGSFRLVPESLHGAAGLLSPWLTLVSMAALGLGVDARMVARAGVRVSLSVVASLSGLTLLAITLIRFLRIA